VARLGARVNEMVVGLRTKLALEKFVSRGTAAAASSGQHPEGERWRTVVLFSDIRGFTAYSEDRAPEEVVAMLNQLLGVQAEVVHRHGGDIDKFVGDELMAEFHGDQAERRAVTCAVEMIDAVERLGLGDLAVGIGINGGEVVRGAIGQGARLDFTVIGDVVNTGARLCSAAAPGEVLVSRAVREGAGEIDGLVYEEGEPLPLKGKRKPFPVLRVRRESAG
jgi:adenylate cyclase